MTDALFGPLLSRGDVFALVAHMVETWADEYLAWAERITPGWEPGQAERPRTVARRVDLRTRPGDQLPAILVVIPGWTDPADYDGDGLYIAKWDVRLAPVVGVSSVDEDHADLLDLYMVAMAALIQQQRDPADAITGVLLLDQAFDVFPPVRGRTFMGGQITTSLWTQNAGSRHGGPPAGAVPRPVAGTDPVSDSRHPYPDGPTVQTIHPHVTPR